MTDNQTQLDTNDCWCKCGAVYRSNWQLAEATIPVLGGVVGRWLIPEQACPKCNEFADVIRARRGGKVTVLNGR